MILGPEIAAQLVQLCYLVATILFILALLVVLKWLPPMVYTPLWVDPS